MKNLTFVTGNAHKAAYLEKHLGIKVRHEAVDVPEIQSLDLKEVVTAKAKSAYAQIGGPVLVEDVGLQFQALGRLPGPFIKWFVAEGLERICRLLDGFDDRSATIQLMYCLYDGTEFHYFESQMSGRIAEHPRGDGGFGYDSIFIHENLTITRAELSLEEHERRSPRYAPLASLREFLTTGG